MLAQLKVAAIASIMLLTKACTAVDIQSQKENSALLPNISIDSQLVV